MQRKFISNLGFLIFVNLIVKPLYIFGIDRVIQNIVGEEAYGTFYSIMKFALIMNILLDLGIENFNRKELARNEAMLDKYVSNFVILKLFLGAVYIIIGIGAGIVSGYTWVELKFLVIILINEFLRCFVLYLRANLGGLHKFKTDSIFSVLDRVVMIIICGFLLLKPGLREHFKIEWFIFSQTLAYLISALFAFYSVMKEVNSFKPGIKRNYNFAIIKQLFPYALLVFLMSIYTHIDPFLIERLLPDGKHQAGIYAQSSRILEMCSNYSYLFAVILLPVYSRMLGKKQNIEKLLRFSFFIIIVPSLLAVAGFNIFQKEILTLLYVNQDPLSPKVFSTLMISLLAISSTYIYGTLLTANGNLKYLNLVAFLGVIISISLNVILIPVFKSYGASIANISSQIITALIQIILVHRIFKVQPNYKRIIQILFYFITLFVSGKYLNNYWETHWIIKFLIIGFTGLIIAALMIKKDLRSFMQVVKEEDKAQ